MKPRKLLIHCLFLFIGMGGSYFLALNNFVIYDDRHIPEEYKQFLLKNSSGFGGRIIIMGASDVFHGINALEMERHFNMPVINLAENGNYPLKHEIYNVKQYVEPEDIVILSLQWLYYFGDDKLSKQYITSIVDKREGPEFQSNSFFYRTLPFFEKVKFVFSDLPYSVALQAGFAPPNKIKKISIQMDSIRRFAGKISSDNGDSRGSSLSEGPEDVSDDGSRVLNCDGYLFFSYFIAELDKHKDEGRIQFSAHETSEIKKGKRDILLSIMDKAEKKGIQVNLKYATPTKTFQKNLELLGIFKNLGVKVYFAWPIAVTRDDRECYLSKYSIGLDRLVKRIEEMINNHGYEFLGHYRGARFSKDCFLDTYAHIKRSCVGINTKRLINDLLSKGIKPKENGYHENKLDEHIRKRLSIEMDKLLSSSLKSGDLDLLPENGIGRRQLEKYIIFYDGWSEQEDWGIWSEGKESSFFLLNVEDRPVKSLLIEGIYFNGEEQTEVYLNGINLGVFVLTKKELYIPMKEQGAEIFHVELKHKKPISPMELNSKNTDDRKIKFGLTGIKVIYEN